MITDKKDDVRGVISKKKTQYDAKGAIKEESGSKVMRTSTITLFFSTHSYGTNDGSRNKFHPKEPLQQYKQCGGDRC